MAAILVTRPAEDARTVIQALRDRGLTALNEPLLDIVPCLDMAVDDLGAAGILATSGNGIRALAARSARRDLPVWAVGDASARLARDLGFAQVHSAQGKVDDLIALITRQCDPQAGVLLHAAGTVVAGDVSGRLAQAGFHIRRLVLYDAQPAKVLSDSLIVALKTSQVDRVLFFSPRTAHTFVTLLENAGLAHMSARLTAFALSPAVAQALASLSWGAVLVAAHPTQAALLAALDDDLARHTAGSSGN